MRLLDTFCKAGGAGMGYSLADFEVVGVDVEPQPNYPFEFIQGDAVQYIREHGAEYDAIHASPPCQAYCALKTMQNAKEHPELIEPTRAALMSTGRPWIIENVMGAPLENPIMLCGSHFGLKSKCGYALQRHRLFELSFMFLHSLHCHHGAKTVGVYGSKARDIAKETRHYAKPKETRGAPVGVVLPHSVAFEAMGIGWMSIKELSQAIPPAYTEYIGRQLASFIQANDLNELTTIIDEEGPAMRAWKRVSRICDRHRADSSHLTTEHNKGE